MNFSSQKETPDSHPPSGSSSSRTSMSGVLHHRPSKATIQSHQESISNFSVHTSTAAIYKDLDNPSEQGPHPSISHQTLDSSGGRAPSISDHKSSHSLSKPSFGLRNQSLSTIRTTRDPESNNTSTPTSTLRQKFRSLSRSGLEDGAKPSLPSTSRSSRATTPTLITDPNPSPSPLYTSTPSSPSDIGKFQPLATIETSSADTSSIRPASFLPRPDRMVTSWRSRGGTATAKGKKRMLGFMTNILKPNKRPEISVPHNPLHVTHVGFDASTCKFTGLPEDWKRLEDSGVSKSAQERDTLGAVEVVKSYQKDSGNVWDRMGHGPVPGSSQSPPIPGAAHAAYPGVSKFVNDSFVPTPALSPLKKSYSSDDLQSGSPPLSDQYPAATAHLFVTKDRQFPAPPAFFFFKYAVKHAP